MGRAHLREHDPNGAYDGGTMKRALSIVVGLALVAACQTDRRSVAITEASGVAPRAGHIASASVSPGTPCSPCTYARTFTRDRGAPVTDTISFIAAAGHAYVVDLDDLDSQGADATVELNGTSLMRSGSAAHDSASRHVNEVLVLANVNTLVVRLVGKPGSQLRVAVWFFRPVTLDAVTLAPQSSLQLQGPQIGFNSTITNHTKAPLSDIAVQAWLIQPSARRAASGQIVSCGAAAGVLPVGTCVRLGDGILASNALDGFGTLIPGNALAVIQVVGLSGGGVLDSLIVPVILTSPPGPTVLGVAVHPKSLMLNPGDHATLTADVQVSGGAPTTVTWSTSNSVVAIVDANGVVTGIAPSQNFSPYATILARSTADPTKSDSSRVAVFNWQIISPSVPALVSTGATLPASNPLSVVIQAQVCGMTGVFTNPFSRVDFSAASGGVPVMIGSVQSASSTDNGQTRCWTWSFTWTPGNAFGVGPQKVNATGVNAAGATIFSPANTNIATVQP